jgi:hypothetical protein
MDDVTKRVFELAQGCIEELYKQKEYIQYLEEYIGELENGVEVSTTESVQLEQPLEMEKSNDNMDDRRPSAVRRRNAKADKGITRPSSEDSCGISNGDGGIKSAEAAIANSNAG